MSTSLTPEKALIFRILHRDNLATVLRDGCHCHVTKHGNDYVEIGNQELIARRNSREVPCGPGGTLSDYVPFYFTPFSPMLYNIKTGYNGIPKKPMDEIVILVSSLHRLIKQGVPFVFSDRHAYLKTALFSNDIKDLNAMIIWPVLQQRNFRKDDIERFEKYQAEALVHKHVPISTLHGVVCYNDSATSAAKAAAAKHGVALQIISKPTWYV